MDPSNALRVLDRQTRSRYACVPPDRKMRLRVVT